MKVKENVHLEAEAYLVKRLLEIVRSRVNS